MAGAYCSQLTLIRAQILKTEFKSHFRNVSRIMDCVGCDKCRLWGKLQVTGLGTALKLLFSYDESPAPQGLSTDFTAGDTSALVLSRSEAVAFVNTLHRLSESLAAVDRFRTLWAHRGDAITSSQPPSAVVEEEEPPTSRSATKAHPTALPPLNASSRYQDGWRRLLAFCRDGLSTCLERAGTNLWLGRQEL